MGLGVSKWVGTLFDATLGNVGSDGDSGASDSPSAVQQLATVIGAAACSSREGSVHS